MSSDTLACTYAALMLHDAGVAITSDNINAATKAAGLEVRNTLPILFARFLEKKSIADLISAASAAPAAVAAGGAAAPAAAAAGGAAPAAAAKEEVHEEEDDDMGFGLFD